MYLELDALSCEHDALLAGVGAVDDMERRPIRNDLEAVVVEVAVAVVVGQEEDVTDDDGDGKIGRNTVAVEMGLGGIT